MYIIYKNKSQERIPADALPVRSLLNSRDKATIAASICERAVDLTVGPISGTT